MKTAVIYDKWLHSLGGGEVVACNLAKILVESGYKVIFISGKLVPKETILEKLKIDTTNIKFIQIWNDEVALRKVVKNKTLFVNVSFMDYSRGFAKKNIYYTHFPTRPYDNFRGMIFTKIIIPLVSKFIRPIESMHLIDAPIIMQGSPAYLLKKVNRYALYAFEINKVQEIEFKIFIENFDKRTLENIDVLLENADFLSKKVSIDHDKNIIHYSIKFIPRSISIYLTLISKNSQSRDYDLEGGKIYLLYPKMELRRITSILPDNLFRKINNKLRAGVYVNVIERLNTYQKIAANSYFTQRWIRNYWGKESIVLSPPASLIYKKYNIKRNKKKNWICSVGRFFTLGHGKKQELLIAAFKRLADFRKDEWELHLVGGLGNEPSSIEFFKYLKEQSRGYPIFFHINASREEVEKIYLKSRIFWHATGFGESENDDPIRFEHFGIAPIEAISAKCIPILFNGGGLREIIETIDLDKVKHLFNTIDELVDNTLYFQDEPYQILDWPFIFKQISKYYSVQAFKKNFLKLLSSVENK